jgi:NADH-quinone oxidoreductase subunit C
VARPDAVTPEEALDRITATLGQWVEEPKVNFGAVDLISSPDNLIRVMRTLRDAEGLGCVFFTFLSGVDRSELGEGGGGLEVLIHVYSPEHAIHVTVHVPVDPAAPECPSISELYRGALWQERETHEMFGILFPGHPNLTTLYLPEDFEGHPMLRSFKLPTRVVKEWPGAKDPEEAAAGGR